MNPKLSLIIPVFNSEIFIRDTLNRISNWKSGLDYLVEIILINDGSTDNTIAIIEDYILNKDTDIILLSLEKNKGKGYAVKKGMLHAKGLYKVFTDADIPFGFNKVEEVLECLETESIDLCIGNRTDKESQYKHSMSIFRLISSKLFTFFVTKFTIKDVGDTQCGLKGFTDKAAERIFSKLRINGFAFDVESIYLIYKFKLVIKRIPVVFEGNTLSTINLLRSSIAMFFSVLSLPIRYHIFKSY